MICPRSRTPSILSNFNSKIIVSFGLKRKQLRILGRGQVMGQSTKVGQCLGSVSAGVTPRAGKVSKPQSQSTVERSQGRNARQEMGRQNWRKNHGGMLPTVLLPKLMLSYLSYISQNHQFRVDTTHLGLGLSTSIIKQENTPTLAYMSIWWLGHILHCGFLFTHDLVYVLLKTK